MERCGRLVAAGAVALTVTACGSTVQVRGTGTLGGTSGLPVDGGLAAPSGRGPSAPGSVTTGPGGVSSQPGTTGAAVPGAAGPAGTTSSLPPTPASGGGPERLPVGVTAKTITIGVITADGFDKAAGALGVNVATGSARAQATAVADDINAHGGLAGRKLLLVFHDVDVAQAASNPTASQQQVCSAMTQDNKVYAVASAVAFGNELVYKCLTKAGVIASQGGEQFDEQLFRTYASTFYMPVEINMTRVMTTNIAALHAAGFFDGWDPRLGAASKTSPVKIGLIRYDRPNEARVRDQAVKPALARLGLKIAEEQSISTSADRMNAQFQSAVLRFAANGVTHVLFTGASPLYFMLSANNQGYRPRYGLHSRSSPGALLQTSAPASQLHGSMGIGWNQYNDVDGSNDPGPASSRATQCLALMKKAGQDTTARATALAGLWLCDAIFFLRDAAAKAPDLSLAGFRAGAEALSTYLAASTFRSSFAPGRLHDGARAYRLVSYVDSCSCYRYTTPVRSTS